MPSEARAKPSIDSPNDPGAQVRRARILKAMVEVVRARGFVGASVRLVCARAGVSRSTFYDLFDSPEACFLAVIDTGYRRFSALIVKAFADTEDWREGLRTALAELLSLLDREPDLARVCLMDTLAAGSWALERRAQHIHPPASPRTHWPRSA
jgi:AcrR family transcriptional regulator